MFDDTLPAALDASGGSDAWAPFGVGSATERLRVLRELRDRSVPLMLHGAGGTALPTTLWTLDATRQRLGFSADVEEPRFARLVESELVVAVAYIDAVKLQFELRDAVLVRGATASALQCGMPAEIYRFQRRSAYRLRPPAHASPVARLPHPEHPDIALALRIIDLSVGGCALWLPGDLPRLSTGAVLGGMRCELDAETSFTAAATLRNVSSTAPGAVRAGGLRLGCEWHALAGPAERVLQRWIDQAQRRSRLLSMV